jgi:asparagine synthase (glutamine-hydrolysing)
MPELAELVRERVLAAVRRRLPDEGAAGLMLSAGLDSTTVAAAVHALQPTGAPALRAYSGVFPEHPQVDEQPLIEAMVRWLGVPWVRSRIRGGRPLLGTVEHIAAWRLPSTAPNVFLWSPLLRRAAADGARVMLDGEGGDEMFGYVPFLIADLVRRGRPRQARRVAARVPGMGPDPSARRVNRLLGAYALPAALPWQVPWAYRRLRTPGRYAPPYVARADARVVRGLADPWIWMRRDGPRWWNQLVYLLTDQRESLDVHGLLHRRARQFRLHDAHPFLDDLEIVELALRLPPEARFDPRRDRPLLREAMRGLMPEQLRLREEKTFFTRLLGDGLRGPDAGLVERLLRPQSALLAEFVDHGLLLRHLLDSPPERYVRGPTWWASDTWRAASAEAWLRDLAEPGWAARTLAEAGPGVEQELVTGN